VGISLIDDTPQELLYLSLEGINIDLVISDKNQYFEVTIAKAQADNMLYSTIYPIMVYPNIKVRKETLISTSLSSSLSHPCLCFVFPGSKIRGRCGSGTT